MIGIRGGWKTAIGWLAVSSSTAALLFWAFWGTLETFHEGWYYRSFWMNIALTLVQYLMPVLILMVAAVTGILWPRAGALVHAGLGIAVSAVIRTPIGIELIGVPLILLAMAYWFGRIQGKKWALFAVCLLPIATVLALGVAPAYRVSQRIDDGIREARLIRGNGVVLWWAPEGPGWPEKGGDWFKAKQVCACLTSDGKNVTDTPTNVWRLPSADELVRSMALHGQNAGGAWDSTTGKASFQKTPDKESPLWNIYSPVIYWWTGTEADSEHAYRISYQGGANVTKKTAGPAYYGFRCVRSAT